MYQVILYNMYTNITRVMLFIQHQARTFPYFIHAIWIFNINNRLLCLMKLNMASNCYYISLWVIKIYFM